MNWTLDPLNFPSKTPLDFEREYRDWLAKQKQQGAANEELKQRQQAETQRQGRLWSGLMPKA